ncbi:hypothetical protein RB653_007870 [Dictyostelium firmibasis]|uniref:THH1/TOM1/TOM3 domain-containing protein n=1 Tax=Dictyostelium firmibasis TaxID=79012 RepID=A0AAN7YRY3_9MYCE
MIRRIVFLFFFATILKIINCEELKNVNSNYTIKSVNLLDTNIKIVSGSIYFEEPIYLLESYTCPNATCEPYPTTCPPCDYTHKGCNKGYSDRPAECEPCDTQFSERFLYTPCQMSWQDIELGVETQGFVDTYYQSYKLYRFYTSSECVGYKITFKTLQGYGEISSDIYPFYPLANGAARIVQTEECDASIIMCPSSPALNNTYAGYYRQQYPYGTVHIGIKNMGSGSDLIFKLLIEEIPIIPPSPTPLPTCVNVHPDYQCINDGEEIYIPQLVPVNTFLKYSLTVDTCKNITISNVVLENDVDIFATDDILNLPNFSNLNYKWSSTLSLDDNLIIQICPNNNEKNKTLFFGIYTFYESDVYFYISSFGKYKLRDITNNPSLSGTWALAGTSHLEVIKTGKIFLCENYDADCTIYLPSYPRNLLNPLYPVPSVYGDRSLNVPKFGGIAFNESNTPKENTYQFGLIISLTVDGITYNYFNENDLSSTVLTFKNRLVYGNGTLIVGSKSIGNQVFPDCQYKEFSKVDSTFDNILKSIDNATSSTIGGLRYYLDVLSFVDDYNSCQQMAERLLNLNQTISLKNTTLCTATSDLTNYFNDPCCSFYATFKKACKPRLQNITTINFINVNSDKVNDQCSFPDCTESVLNTFSETVVGTQFDQCSVSQDEQNYYSDSLYKVFRSCKSTIYSSTCKVDSDCTKAYPGSNYTCNIRNGLCLLPFSDLELKFIQCILLNISTPLKTDVLLAFNLSHIQDYENQSIELYNRHLSNDCNNPIGISSWARKSFSYSSSTFTNLNCFPIVVGLDQSTPSEIYDSCLAGVNVYSWLVEAFNEDSCNVLARCDWMGSSGTMEWYNTYDTTKLINDCLTNTPDYFCGDCTDPLRNCYVDNNFNNQSACELNNFVCYNQDHSNDIITNFDLITVNDPNECLENYGSCSVSCGLECSQYTGCFIPSLNQTNPSCFDANNNKTYSPWFDSKSSIYYCIDISIDNHTCSTNYINSIFKNCGDFNYNQCTYCNDLENGCNSFGLACGLNEIQCTTKSQCESSGKCDDSLYFQYYIGNYYPYQPKCLYPRNTKALLGNSLPTCEYGTQIDSPLGCFNLSLINQTTCEQSGGKWWNLPAINQLQCENNYNSLCYGIDRSPGYLLPLTFRFNEKNQDDCNFDQEIWKKPFSWVGGIWTPSISVPLKWIKNNEPITFITEYGPSLDLGRFFTSFENAASSRTNLLYKSEILCRTSNSKNSLEALSCGCSIDGNGDRCYDNLDTPVLKVIKPCYDPSSTQIFNDGLLEFSMGSIDENSCVSISIGQIFKETFLSKKVISLSSTFVSFDKPDDYSIFNNKKAVIGKLLTDGINLEIFDNGVINFKICMFGSISRNSKNNPYVDFGYLENENQGQLIPLECNIEIDNYNRYCCLINFENSNGFENIGGINNSTNDSNKINFISIGKRSYFLIERISNWKSETFKPFNKSSSALLYILAILFCLMGIYGLLHLGFFTLQKILSTEPFKLVHLLFLVLTSFSLIRSIYFFVLPSGIITETTTVGNYILVVLPTFLYFTAFTIVIVIWYMLSNASSFSNDIYSRINTMVLLINIVLYLVFIIIVIVYNFTKQSIPPSCGGRLSINLKQTTPQNAVSIFYAVLQACLSLAIGIAFIYYGRQIYKKLSALSTKVSQTANKQRNRTFVITVLCSTGFVLHCIFIIILVSVNPSNIIFSFIGLIVTEMIPVVVLLVTNNQIPIGKYTRKSIKSIIKMKSSNTSSTDLTSTSTSTVDQLNSSTTKSASILLHK